MSSFVSPPPHWKIVKLGDVANVEFSSVDKKAVDDEIPVVLCNYHDVVSNYRIRSGIDFMPATATAKEVDKWTLQQNDVVFTKDAEIGKVSLVEENIPNLVCGYHLGRARPKQDIVFGPFLAEALKTPVTQKQITRLQTGLTISGIRLGDMRSVQLLLPPFEEQKHIASVLGSVDEAIEKMENVIVKTVQLRDALLHELLSRGVPGHHKEGVEVPGEAWPPPPWKVVILGDIAEVQKGTSFTSKDLVLGDIPVIAGGREPAYYHKYSNRPPNTITVSASGDAGYVSIHRKPIFASDCITVRPKPEISVTNYIYYFLKHNQNKIYRLRTGSALPHVYRKDIARFIVILPPLEEQISIARYLDSVSEVIDHNRQVMNRQSRLRDALLHDLLTRGLPNNHND